MAFLADTGVPRPPPRPRLALRVDHAEWLITGVYAALLAAILLIGGSLTDGRQAASSDTAVCHQRVLKVMPGLYFLPIH